MHGGRSNSLPNLESSSAPRLTPRVFDPPLPSSRRAHTAQAQDRARDDARRSRPVRAGEGVTRLPLGGGVRARGDRRGGARPGCQGRRSPRQSPLSSSSFPTLAHPSTHPRPPSPTLAHPRPLWRAAWLLQGVEMVLNYEFPTKTEDYVHRIGRTGRAGAKGHAVTFMSAADASHAAPLVKVDYPHLPLNPALPLTSTDRQRCCFSRFRSSRTRACPRRRYRRSCGRWPS